MKKSVFGTLMVLPLAIGLHAQAFEVAKDSTQAYSDSSLKAETVAHETVTKGQRHVEDAKTLLSQGNDVAKQKNNAHEKLLSPPQIVDDRMDLEKTMKLMGKNFKALNKASTLKAMVQPAQNLQKWAAQAQALGLQAVHEGPATVEERQGFAEGMIRLRAQIAALEAAIERGDQADAARFLKQLNEIRKRNHKIFK